MAAPATNHIQALTATVITRERQNAELRQQMQDFSAYLCSPKFHGEYDWIRTWEVLDFIQRLRSTMTAADDVSLIRKDPEA